MYRCSNDNSNQALTQDASSSKTVIALKIDTFSTFPPEIDGCSCYFSADSIAFKSGSFIYLNDLGQTSFLKINGVLTKFVEKSHKELDSVTMVSRSKSDNYDLFIEVKDDMPSGDETQIKKGTIKLSDKNGTTITKVFYGECGC